MIFGFFYLRLVFILYIMSHIKLKNIKIKGKYPVDAL